MTTTSDHWSSRYPDGFVIGDLNDSDLAEWRDGARQDEANGYVRPHTTTPIDPRKPIGNHEMENCPSRDWSRGRNPHAQIGERSAWKPLKE